MKIKKVKDLIKMLSKFDGDLEVGIEALGGIWSVKECESTREPKKFVLVVSNQHKHHWK